MDNTSSQNNEPTILSMELLYQQNYRGMSIEKFINLFPDNPLFKNKENIEYLKYKEKYYKTNCNEKILYQNPKDFTEMLILRKINNKDYIVMVNDDKTLLEFFSSKILTQVNSNKEIEIIINKYKNYLDEKDKYLDLEIRGNKKIDDLTLEITKKDDRYSLVFLKLDEDKNRTVIGMRQMNFSPFESYLKLGLFTICGASKIYNKDYIGKGYGKILYDTIDKLTPYIQIPHGYAGAPFNLTDDSTNFWNKRNKFRPLPDILSIYKKQEDDLNKLNNRDNNSQIFSMGREINLKYAISFYLSLQKPDIHVQITDDYLSNGDEYILINDENRLNVLTSYFDNSKCNINEAKNILEVMLTKFCMKNMMFEQKIKQIDESIKEFQEKNPEINIELNFLLELKNIIEYEKIKNEPKELTKEETEKFLNEPETIHILKQLSHYT
jgi:hypothetical protein